MVKKSRNEIAMEVRTLISGVIDRPLDDIPEMSVLTDLSADSIQLFELLLAFEKYYEIETAYDDVVKLHTVKDIVDYVSRVKYGTEHV